MKTHFWGALLITLSVCSTAAAKDQGHGKVSLGGEIVETPCGIAGESLDQSVDFGLISISDAAQGANPALIGSRRTFEIKLVNCELASQVKPDFIYRAANVTFDGTADSRDPALLGVQGTARGVAIELLTESGVPIPLGSTTADYLIVTGDNRLRFGAQLRIHSDRARAGEFSSLAKFTLSYL
ncbi:Fimbria A protein precursor [Serratia entomophila]|jgi:type 1 fimbria pilin|uniref:Type 1 fimbrial protein n=1 Tax=Serratia entomophila TaxID=42906 RepID=A0ABY5CSX8_9GAMM|nr:fimbrial protein [Serratia entomophila]UIW18454.1 type 1 fimbrial protein [Serratia entomophila]USV00772.1 type 1 fimbrial protein [Serratia entomophila]CAI0912349.1 Fimbria A protein precursor [Serratia entomophila]CAI0987941.1 Fimbria A protein precursor [Serratia entomophila]CAI0988687.1 Fimbria A protein precursor [Serratia entomophila]